MNVLAQILPSKVRSGIFRLLFGTDIPVCPAAAGQELHLQETESKTGFAIGTVRQPGLKDRIIWD